MKITKTVTSIIIALLIFVFGFFLGQISGKSKGIKETQNQLQPLIDLAFPKPAEEIKNLTGTIKGVYGATIDFEINDPDDYLPHIDGSPQKKEIFYVYITSNTKISSVNIYTGAQIELNSSNLKVGDTVKIYSNENIRKLKKFDATEIQVIKS